MSVANEASGLIDRLKEARLPMCPKVRQARGKWLYPVEGYCVLGGQPGYMIPSLQEFRAYCTTSHYCECPWFSAPPSCGSPQRDGAFPPGGNGRDPASIARLL